MTEFEGGERVLLIRGRLSVSAPPGLVEARASSSGRTCEAPATIGTGTHRLPADELLAGEVVRRDQTYYVLYTPERYERASNGPSEPSMIETLDETRPLDEIPDPTHQPIDESEG